LADSAYCLLIRLLEFVNLIWFFIEAIRSRSSRVNEASYSFDFFLIRSSMVEDATSWEEKTGENVIAFLVRSSFVVGNTVSWIFGLRTLGANSCESKSYWADL